MHEITCCKCFVVFGVPEKMYEARKEDHESFWCPVGHQQHFLAESEKEKLRHERDLLKQRLAQKDDEISDAKRLREQAEAKVARITKRIHNGVCTCCNRSFANLARHMKTKHPEAAKLKVA